MNAHYMKPFETMIFEIHLHSISMIYNDIYIYTHIVPFLYNYNIYIYDYICIQCVPKCAAAQDDWLVVSMMFKSCYS